ncbi:homoserine dehydrogenase [Ihubacter sp. mB4P-1]|uniref:homoserine dehydrogenase n=1 Tax=Ihubacter sp. mB4P-1 TaxID=3242370 RepID=UPI003C7C705D
MKKIKLAMIGYGNVGKAFGKMLKTRKQYIAETYDIEPVITAICTRRKGALLDSDGIDTDLLEDRVFDKNVSSMEVIEQADYDVMIELTPINIMTGQPAISHVRSALERKKHVITANKGTIAWAYRELKNLAAENHVIFCHEATVMDGVPVFNLAKETLKACKITEVKGILNATTNYVLDQMEKGVSYEDAIKEGQRRGFVEADPSMDLEGWDAAAKLTALMNVLMDVKITPPDIKRTGISEITKEQLLEAAKHGQKIKLVCHGWLKDGKPVGTVQPQAVNGDDLLASINGTAAAVTVNTDLMGEVSIIEHVYEPEIDQTAYGVLSDLLRILTDAENL